MREEFAAEGCVILTSKIAIDCYQWRKDLESRWGKIMRPNSKLLVLAGIHGGPRGKLGQADFGLLDDYERHVKFLKNKYNDEIANKNIEIVVENVGSHMGPEKLNEETFVEAVIKHKPTIISLAFCFTNVSELNNVLRAAGIYTLLILTKDRAEITEDRCVVLDKTQQDIIQTVAKKYPKNIFLWGSSGTGKTILLTEILKMKMGQYSKNGQKLNIFVTSYMAIPESQLIKDLKEKYFNNHPSVNEIQFIAFRSLCQGN